ncbi:MAG: preprotein translocase subunit YajC [Thermoguttaceae bacterium]|nr:preprotein translocase subunit YajC [Thermoguttaceae bacterium]MDW8077387.1 preprotein translocase subunit YajC [Thermoguttaceae bacterium]
MRDLGAANVVAVVAEALNRPSQLSLLNETHGMIKPVADLCWVAHWAQPVLAQEQPPAAEGPSLFGLLWPIVAIIFLFWLLLIRPQQKERAKIAQMLANLKKNDRVITIGGIYGVVTNIRREADEVTLKVDDSSNVRIKVSLGAIARVLGQEGESEESGEKKST